VYKKRKKNYYQGREGVQKKEEVEEGEKMKHEK
jgi:hypothetical protein